MDNPFDLPDDLDDIREQAEEVGFLTPREYAKIRGMAPQMVYYYIRNGVLETEHCRCGRRVLDVAKADNDLQAKEEARRSKLDARDIGSTLD
jgi:hypothetical protein